MLLFLKVNCWLNQMNEEVKDEKLEVYSYLDDVYFT